MFKPEYKEQLIHYGILLGILVGFSIILVSATLLSRSSWKKSLAKEVQVVLDQHEPGLYRVENFIKIKTSLSTSASLYEIRNMTGKTTRKYYAIIIRVPTLLGPAPAVFIYNNITGSEFAGFAIDVHKAGNLLDPVLTSGIMKYWSNQIPEIVFKAVN